MDDIKTKMIDGLKKILGIDYKQAASLILDLPFSKYVEVYSAIRLNQPEKLSQMFGVTETPSINNVKPLADVTAGSNQAPELGQPNQPNQTNQAQPPTYKQGDKLTITTPEGDKDADFSKLLPNGEMEIKIDNQIQKINPNDQNFTVAAKMPGVDENTSAGCIASGPAVASAKKQPHIYTRKTK